MTVRPRQRRVAAAVAAATMALAGGPVPRAAAQFTSKCAYTPYPGAHAFDAFGYTLGVVNGTDPAVEFTITLNATEATWGAIGVRAIAVGLMRDLDIMAVDTVGLAAQDFEATTGSGAPTASAETLSDVSGFTDVGASKEIKMFRLLDNGVDYTIENNVQVNIATATGAGEVAATWTRHARNAASDHVFSACAAMDEYFPKTSDFRGVCPFTTLPQGEHAFNEFGYTLGVVNDKPAVEFALTIPSATETWGAVGLRAVGATGGMVGLDITAVDTTQASAHDFEPTRGSGAPTKSATTRAVVTSYQDFFETKKIRFYRLFDNGVDYALQENVPVNIASAMGDGRVAETWTRHTANKQVDHTFKACAALAPYFAPKVSAFEEKCPYVPFPGEHAFEDFGYALGIVDDKPAVEFTIRIPKDGMGGEVYAAVGLRRAPSGAMGDLDITAVDSSARIVHDFDVTTIPGAPVPSATTRSVITSLRSVLHLVEIKFYRHLDNGVDYRIENNATLNVATATGRGVVADTWTRHTARASSPHIFVACANLEPYLATYTGEFEGLCPYEAVAGGHVFDTLQYAFGVAGGKPAIEFKINLAQEIGRDVYAGIGMRGASTGYPMRDLDITAMDTTDAVVYDFETSTTSGAPARSPATRSRVSRVSNLGAQGFELVWYRLLDNGYDYPINPRRPFNLATSRGYGKVATAWSKHIARVAADVTLRMCTRVEPLVTGFTPLCNFTAFSEQHAFEAFGYRLGITSAGQTPAVEFVVRFKSSGGDAGAGVSGGAMWAGLGIRRAVAAAGGDARDGRGRSMDGFDIMAVDSSADRVRDFRSVAAVGPPGGSGATRTVLTSYSETDGVTEAKFYRLWDNGVDVPINHMESVNVGTAVGAGTAGGSWTKHTQNIAVDHTFRACPALIPFLDDVPIDHDFEPLCPAVVFSDADHALNGFGYTLGKVQEAPAIEFTVRIPKPPVSAVSLHAWAGVGLRAAGAVGGMRGLDITAVDTNATAVRTHDFEVTSGGGIPTESSSPLSRLSAFSDVGTAKEVKFYRLLDNGVDFTIRDGVAMNIATSTGLGTIGVSWTRHTKYATVDHTMTACPELRQLLPGVVPFRGVCPYAAWGTDLHDFGAFGYTLGLVGDAPAVMFTLRVAVSGNAAATSYAVMGLQPAPNSGRVDYIAIDTASGIVRDYTAASLADAPVPLAETTTVLAGYADVDGTKEIKFYRLLGTRNDSLRVPVALDRGMGVATAGGFGTVADAWADATLKTSKEVVFAACDAFEPYVPTDAPALIRFDAQCPPVATVAVHAFDAFEYRLGTIDDRPAIEFMVQLPRPTAASSTLYAAVGLRNDKTRGSGMVGLDITALDTSAAVTHDFDVATRSGRPTASANTVSFFTGRTEVDGAALELRFARLLDNGVDFVVEHGAVVNLATARGEGVVKDTWSRHVQNVAVDETIAACGSLRVLLPKYLCFEVRNPERECPGGGVDGNGDRATCTATAAWDTQIREAMRVDLSLDDATAAGVLLDPRCVVTERSCGRGCIRRATLAPTAPLSVHDSLHVCATTSPNACPDLVGVGLVASAGTGEVESTLIPMWLIIVICAVALMVLIVVGGWYAASRRRARELEEEEMARAVSPASSLGRGDPYTKMNNANRTRGASFANPPSASAATTSQRPAPPAPVEKPQPPAIVLTPLQPPVLPVQSAGGVHTPALLATPVGASRRASVATAAGGTPFTPPPGGDPLAVNRRPSYTPSLTPAAGGGGGAYVYGEHNPTSPPPSHTTTGHGYGSGGANAYNGGYWGGQPAQDPLGLAPGYPEGVPVASAAPHTEPHSASRNPFTPPRTTPPAIAAPRAYTRPPIRTTI